ncbi:MAG: FmdE family protein [Chloroflexi bacterium]|nr:FmdE family protein [Chloroflexota bacterium]
MQHEAGDGQNGSLIRQETQLGDLLRASSALHSHLCPRQVLGVRMGLYAGELLNLSLPRADKQLLTITETDGCAADGLSVATGCWVGRRTLRIEDYGKVAATFVDTLTEQAVRIVPRPEIRDLASSFAPEAPGRWKAQLLGYQRMPAHLLFQWSHVRLLTSVHAIVSKPGRRVTCVRCREEILNDREVIVDGRTLCRPCSGLAYYTIESAEESCGEPHS